MGSAKPWSSACGLHIRIGAALLVLVHAQRPRPHPEVKVEGKNLFVDGAPWFFKGICWNPVGYNGTQPDDLDFAGYVEKDGDMFVQAGINAIRVYEPIEDLAVLDALWERGIFVVQQVYINAKNPPEFENQVKNRVEAVMNHPTTLMWEVGNEWNYNQLYTQGSENPLTNEEARERVRQAVDIIKATDNTQNGASHPVATNLGEIAVFDPNSEFFLDLFNVLNNVDVWGINVYRNDTFSDLFYEWMRLSNKPLYIGEYGVDAWDARPEVSSANMRAHADGTRWLTEELFGNSTIYGGALFGGFIFEFADEWWKDSTGRGNDWHDIGGIAPGGGPFPDVTFNEEWWGLVDLWRVPRPAWYVFSSFVNPVAGYCPGRVPGGNRDGSTFMSMSCSAATPALQDTPVDTDQPPKFLMNL